jgi:predicted transcriptional regulator
MESNSTKLISLTSTVVGAFVGSNAIDRDDIPALIGAVHKALASADEPEAAMPDTPTKSTAAQIRRSITADALISFEDGRPYKTLKRHLTAQGMTVAEYRAKWGLPKNYPTTAPAYSARRSAMAKAAGLGQPRTSNATTKHAPARRGRPKNSVA